MGDGHIKIDIEDNKIFIKVAIGEKREAPSNSIFLDEFRIIINNLKKINIKHIHALHIQSNHFNSRWSLQ